MRALESAQILAILKSVTASRAQVESFGFKEMKSQRDRQGNMTVTWIKFEEENVMLKPKDLRAQYITDETGEKTYVILPIEEFLELLEDIEDLATVAERRDEPTISHEKLVAELKKDGLI